MLNIAFHCSPLRCIYTQYKDLYMTIRNLKDNSKKPWLGDKPEHRRLSALIEIWFTMYGTNLSKV